MIVVTTGSRHWTDEETIYRRIVNLANEYSQLTVVHGASPGGGADKIVAEACDSHKIRQWRFPIEELDGNYRYAGLNRNTRMLKSAKPDLVIAFRAVGKSNGTDDTIKKAHKLQIPVEIIHEQANCDYFLS